MTRQSLAALCHQAEVTTVRMGAYRLASLVQEASGGARLPPFTRIVTGGSRVPGSLRRQIKSSLTESLFVLYAASEVGVISVATPDQHDRYPEGVGVPAADALVEIVDAEGRPVQAGEIGEIRVRRSGMATEYLADYGRSSNFNTGWFYPRDLVSMRDGEPMIFHGRADDVMILNGVNIFPAAIEDFLESQPGVLEAIAYPVKSRVHGEIPVAAVVIEHGGKPEVAHLLDLCRNALGIRAPREIFIVDRIPRNAAGKPLRRELAAR
jgi:acyl-coenzyme A synthetase/AMP-(fatty) acid ligase